MPRSFSAGFEAVPLRPFHRHVHMAFRLADVVGAAGRGRIGKLLDEVDAADFRRAHAALARTGIDQPLDQIGRFRTPRAPIGVDRRGMGENGAHRDVDVLDIVEARRHRDADDRDHRPVGVEIGAHIGDDVDLEAEEAALLVHRHRSLDEVVAAMGIDQEVLGAVADPLHRPAETARRFHRQRVFAIVEGLRAKAAADIVGDDADLLRRHLEDVLGQRVADAVHALRAERHREALVFGAPFGETGARLHVVGDETVVVEGDARHMRRLVEGRLRLLAVALFVKIDLVGAELRPDERRAIVERGGEIGGRVLGIEIDLDQLGGVLRLADRIGDDEGDGVADMAHIAVGEKRDIAHRMVAAVRLRRPRQAFDRSEMGKVGRRQDEMDAGRRLRRVERADGEASGRQRRAQHEGLQAALTLHIVGEAALAADQREIFLAQRGRAHSEFRCSDIHATVPYL